MPTTGSPTANDGNPTRYDNKHMLNEFTVERDTLDSTTITSCLPATLDTTCLFGGRTMITMGNRSQDHRVRDLLLGSLLRDARTRLVRKYCRGDAGWMPPLPTDWPKKFWRQGCQLTVLGSMHQHFLDMLRDSIPFHEGGQAEKMLNAVQDCIPMGALFDRRDENDRGRPCGYSKLCPWCHARNVERIYRRLMAGPCSKERLEGKSLVMVQLSGYDTTCGGGSVLDRTEVQSLRENSKQSARFVANDLEMEGGIIFHQFGPKRVYGPRATVVDEVFCHEITMLGESKNIRRERVREYEDSGYDVLCVPAETPHALRYLLFGTSYKFPVQLIEGLVASSNRFTKRGIQGAAALQPWFLFNETQAWSYLAATAGTRLCDAFGTWRKNGRAAAKPRTEERDGERISREQARRNGNNERHYDAANRRTGLMFKAERVFRRLRSELGRNPGSTALRTALAAAGLVISDRDSRYLAKQMPLYYQGETKLGLAWAEMGSLRACGQRHLIIEN